jgi:hypothetical protein
VTKGRAWRLILILMIAGLTVAGIVLARSVPSSELVWRLKVIAQKTKGHLPQIPIRNLVAWLAPGSPVNLAALADRRNPALAIQSRI